MDNTFFLDIYSQLKFWLTAKIMDHVVDLAINFPSFPTTHAIKALTTAKIMDPIFDPAVNIPSFPIPHAINALSNVGPLYNLLQECPRVTETNQR